MMNGKIMRAEMQDVLENNILHFWQTKMVDHENGGFYGRIDGQEVLHTEAEKGAILNARILWTFSALDRQQRTSKGCGRNKYQSNRTILHTEGLILLINR